jgi:ATP-dependent Lhr-like helicase
VRAEGIPGGFAAVYPALRTLEEAGRARRGYFVAGLGAAQFALPGAAERVRASKPDRDPQLLVLAATDPAQPYGAALPWPELPDVEADDRGDGVRLPRPSRSAGALVVLRDGAPVAFFDPRGHHVLAFDVDDVGWVGVLPDVVRAGRVRRLEIQRVNGVSVRSTPVAVALEHAGFVPTPRGVVLRG